MKREPSVAVLAGGRGERMGAQKAAVELCGRPLVHYPLHAAREAGLAAVVVAKRASELPGLQARVLEEPDEPRHPLCGVLAALHEAGGPVIAVGCDMPFVSGALLTRLAGAQPDGVAAAPRLGGRLQPLPARYVPADVPALEAALAGERSLRATLAELDARVLAESELAPLGDPWRLCFSVNDERDLLTARRWMREG